MKKLTLIMITMTVILAMTALAYGQTSGTAWPPKAGAAAALSCGTNLGALYPLAQGKSAIYCATKTETGYANLKILSCSTYGTQLKCTGGIIANTYDFPALKMQKVCAPSCTTWK